MRKRVAIYARVSTHDKGQNPETQLRQLRQYARARTFTIIEEYVDRGSGRDAERVNYIRLLKDARRRRFDAVLVWRYDRFARSSKALIDAMMEFRDLGVDFVSLHEGLDTSTHTGKFAFVVFAGLAEFESALISDRVKAGMERARAAGKRIGRPPVSAAIRAQIEVLWRKRLPLYQIGKRVPAAYSTIWKVVQGLK